MITPSGRVFVGSYQTHENPKTRHSPGRKLFHWLCCQAQYSDPCQKPTSNKCSKQPHIWGRLSMLCLTAAPDVPRGGPLFNRNEAPSPSLTAGQPVSGGLGGSVTWVLRSRTHNALWRGSLWVEGVSYTLIPLASTPLTCDPLAVAECLPSAHLLPFGLLLWLHLLAGHVAAEAGLDFGGGLVGFRVVQGDVHDVLLLLLGSAALPLLHRAPDVRLIARPTVCMMLSPTGARKIFFYAKLWRRTWSYWCFVVGLMGTGGYAVVIHCPKEIRFWGRSSEWE